MRFGDNKGRWPIRFGITRDPGNIMSQAKGWNYHEAGVALLGLWWVPTLEQAQHLDGLLKAEIGRYAEWSRGPWHDVSVDAFVLWLRHLSEAHGIPVVDEAERRREWEREQAEKLRRVAEALADAQAEKGWQERRRKRFEEMAKRRA